MSSIEPLRRWPLFAELADEELEDLAGHLGRRVFGRGVFIFHKDSPGHLLYFIESGRVRLFVISESGQEVSVDILGPGDLLGDLAVIDERPRATGAVALEQTTTLTLHREDLLRLWHAYPRLAQNQMESLARRLRYTLRFVEDLAFLDVNSRVAGRLLDLAGRCGVQRGGIEIELNLTQGELATWVAASRESINKALATFRTKALIAMDGPKIIILDRRRLEREVRY